MKMSDIFEFKDKLDEYNIPMREKIVLSMDRDEASELLIDMLSLYPEKSKDKIMAKHYIHAGIAYKMIDGSEFAGIRLAAK